MTTVGTEPVVGTRLVEVSGGVALYLVTEDTWPPTVLPVPGWEPTGEILDLDLGKDGWAEAWLMHRRSI